MERHHENRFKVYASAATDSFTPSKDVAKDRLRKLDVLDKKKTIAQVGKSTIDYSWLKGASETYQISANIEDYIIQEVPIVTVDFPNRNLHSFSFDEVSYFDPRFGQFVYRTFIGKPTYVDHCFVGDTLVETKEGLKPIDQIKEGDLVLTDQFRYKPVTNVFKNGVKKITRLMVQGVMEPLDATENHPILVVDRRQVFGRYDAKNQVYRQNMRDENFRDVEYNPHFRPVSDTYRGDYVAIPINYGGDVKADKALAYLAGAYLADGSISCKGDRYPEGACVLYTIGNHEHEFRDEIIKQATALGYRPKHRPNQTQGCDWIMINSIDLCKKITSLCGEYADLKRIQGDARCWDIESTKVFLGGYMTGDGCFDSKKGSYRVRSSSRNLLKDLQQAFAFVGIPACVGIDSRVKDADPDRPIKQRHDSGYLRVNQNFLPVLQKYIKGKQIPVLESKADSGRGVISGKHLLMPIRSIERDYTDAEVYNIEVEEDHTYVAGGIIVHNCNKNFVEAKGVHFDSSLRYVPGWDVWKIYVLLGYDRSKDSSLARQIEKGQRRSYSMGAWVSYFLGSLTGKLSNGSQVQKHPKGSIIDGKLNYDLCSGVEYFETSSVVGPADVSAESHQLWYF
jgi:hypothetical protein